MDSLPFPMLRCSVPSSGGGGQACTSGARGRRRRDCQRRKRQYTEAFVLKDVFVHISPLRSPIDFGVFAFDLYERGAFSHIFFEVNGHFGSKIQSRTCLDGRPPL